MSLIQEALKRQRDDSAGGNAAQPASSATPPRVSGPAQPGQPQSGPPPLTPAVATPPLTTFATPAPASQPPALPELEESETKSRSWVTLVGVVLIVLLLGGGGVWLLIYAFQKWGADKATPAVTQVTPSTPEITEAPAPVAAVPPTAPAGTAPSGVVVASAPDGAAGAPPPPVVTTIVEPASPDSKAPVAWPYLRVTGIAGKGVRGAATINGKVLSVGDFVDGAEVISIGEYGARMEFEGESRFVKVGGNAE